MSEQEDLTKPTSELTLKQQQARHTLVMKYLETNPTATHKQLLNDTKLQISIWTFYQCQKKLELPKKTNTKKKKIYLSNIQKIHEKNRRILKLKSIPESSDTSFHARNRKLMKLLEENPDMTYSKCPLKVAPSTFANYRRRICGPSQTQKIGKAGRIYKIIWSKSTEGMDQEIREVLIHATSDIVKTLNEGGIARWQLIQVYQPSVLEIREMDTNN